MQEILLHVLQDLIYSIMPLVILAILLSQNNNLLVLDEPTNHLDIQSREVLLKALKQFEGTILFVSHDRHFLKELTEKVIEVDRSQVLTYLGDYNYYLQKKGLS